jgi:3-methyladenine DNA glycosylase AlkC
MGDEPFLIKDFFNRDSIGALGAAIAQADPSFDAHQLLDLVFDAAWEGRELKQRMRHISDVLRSLLPDDYRSALAVLLDAAPHAKGLGFPAMVFSDFVEAFGTNDWDASVPALARFTTLVSAEFAIRPFIASDQDRTLAQMLVWAEDSDPAVRRLATEGSRPRLPWGMRLQALVADPRPVFPILDKLRSDPDENVRRSVANNLNDIAKDHPAVVLEVLRSWGQAPDEHLPALRAHALRTLLKRGDPDAMMLLGFRPDPKVALQSIEVDPPVAAIGTSARLHFVLASTGKGVQPVLVDYAVHYVKADGSTSPKVFKLKTLDLEPGGVVTFSRKLTFVQMSTRTHRPGTHRVEVQVNGVVVGGADFELIG